MKPTKPKRKSPSMANFVQQNEMSRISVLENISVEVVESSVYQSMIFKHSSNSILYLHCDND